MNNFFIRKILVGIVAGLVVWLGFRLGSALIVFGEQVAVITQFLSLGAGLVVLVGGW